MIDPYTNAPICIERLLGEYKQHKNLIIAVDFDDTVFDFHGNGHTYNVVIDILKKCQKMDFHLVLFTGTHPDRYEAQIAYLASFGIHIKFINQNPIPLPFGNHGKIYYNLLLDDRAGLGQALYILSSVITEIERGEQ